MGPPGGKEATGGLSPQAQLLGSFRAGVGARPSLLESTPEAGRCARGTLSQGLLMPGLQLVCGIGASPGSGCLRDELCKIMS